MNESSAVRLYSFHSFLSKLFFFLPIIVIWFQDLGFGQFEVTIIMSSFFLSATVTEIPSGIFTDKFGHKWSLFICGVLEAIGMIIIANSTQLHHAIIGEIFNGVGYAFYTGTKESYLFNYLSVLGHENSYQKYFARAKFYEFIGMAVSGLVGGSVYVFWKEFPFHLSAATFALSSIAALFMPEPKKEKGEAISSLSHLLNGFRHLIRGPKNLKLLIGYYCFFQTSMLLFLITFNQPYLKDIGVPLILFGVAFLLFNIASMVGSELAHHLSNRLLTPTFFLVLGLGLSLSLLSLGFIHNPSAVIVIIVMHLAWGLFFPTTSHEANKLIDSKNRATVLATQDFGQNLIFVLVAPFLGIAADLWGISASIIILSGFSMVTALLSFRMKRV